MTAYEMRISDCSSDVCSSDLDIAFNPKEDLRFDRMGETPVHPNTLRFAAYDSNDEEVLVQRWCSIGGGFIALEDRVGDPALDDDRNLPLDRKSTRLNSSH